MGDDDAGSARLYDLREEVVAVYPLAHQGNEGTALAHLTGIPYRRGSLCSLRSGDNKFTGAVLRHECNVKFHR